MPFTVRDLIDEHRKPVTVHPEDPLHLALTRMAEYDYSQLPLVDGEDHALGMVTSDSILRAQKAFDVTSGRLLALDAKTKASVFREDDDLFDLLDDLRDSYAVLIVDDEKRVTGVVTGYDATEYFRRRTEDMMWVEDIEVMLKDLIQAAHALPSGDLDETALQHAIQHSARGASAQRKSFIAALQRYLNRCAAPAGAQPGTPQQKPGLNATIAGEVFAELFESEIPKTIDQLTFAEFEELLLGKEQWPRYAGVFDLLSAGDVRHMLDAVRTTRNVLAHFRADVTPDQHADLKFCVTWLREHTAARLQQIAAAEAGNGATGVPSLPSASTTHESESSITEEARALPDEVIGPRDSRYAPLALFLRGLPRDRDRLSLTFAEVEEIIHDSLPPFARQHRAFWSNDTVSHSQSRQWLEVDWRVANVDMAHEVVVFARIKEREKQYIAFFSALMAQLRESAEFAIRPGSPDGQSWHTIAGVPERGPQVATLAYAFARNHRFRIELYIDTGDKERNKRIFDYLYARRYEVEQDLLPAAWGDSMSNPLDISMGWERLDEKRASRVGLYCAASITDNEAARDLTIGWAAGATPDFHKLMNRLVTEAVQAGA